MGWTRAAMLLLLASTATAQTTGSGEPPRTAWVRPDLNGVWDFRTGTPLERLDALAGKAVLTEEEAAAVEEQFASGLGGGDFSFFPGGTAADNEFWFDFGTRLTDRRTSLIVTPRDGKIPTRTALGQQRVAARPNAARRSANGPEDRTLNERCLATRVPITVIPAANYLQLFQTEHYVAILQEYIHDARIIPIGSRPPLPRGLRQWAGASRGHWEGDTLIVETAQCNGKASFQGAGTQLSLVERFARVDSDTLQYEFMINDPELCTEPWSVRMSMMASSSAVYEFACHEGNRSMELILGGARALERTQTESR